MMAKGYVSVGYCLLLQLYKLRGDERMQPGNRLSYEGFTFLLERERTHQLYTFVGTDGPKMGNSSMKSSAFECFRRGN